MTHGMNAFFDNPDQWELFKRERPDTAADEIVRWATPVHCFQRTASADTELGGVTIREGQRVGLFYSSANYDEEVFDSPSDSISCATPTHIWDSAATVRTTASARTWPGWRSS